MFKPGDKVVCVNAPALGGLIIGEVYTVREVEGIWVSVCELDEWYAFVYMRFELSADLSFLKELNITLAD